MGAYPMDRLDDPQLFIPDILASHAKWYPNKEAVICGARRATWAEFNAGITRVANGLLAMGIGRGDKVAIAMTNSVDMLEVMFGIVKAGACAVPLSSLLSPEAIATLIDDSDACAIFVSAPLDQLVRPGEAGLTKLRADGRFALGFEAPGWRALQPWAAGQSMADPGIRYRMTDDFNIIYSSGTTGIPKGIVQSHKARHHWAYSNSLELRVDRTAKALTTTSLCSNGTFLVMLPALFMGATLVVMESFDPRGFLEILQRERCTHTFMVPTQWIVTMALPDFDDYDKSSLQVMLCAGSPLRGDTKLEIVRRFGPNITELYGCSEGLATMLRPAQMEGKIGTVGTPVLGFELAIIGNDDKELPRGEVGEIVGYGPGLMTEYYKRPEATADTIWRDPHGRSFIRTGDIGRLDEDGFLTILDRKKDMIISGGFNVFAIDIETVLGKHPDVLDVTVIAVPHDKWGETPLGVVIPRAGAATPAAEVCAWANERLSKHQRLSGVVFRDELPRNALGKVLKRELRREFWPEGS